jgi:hypothetical protein
VVVTREIDRESYAHETKIVVPWLASSSKLAMIHISRSTCHGLKES